MEIRNQMFDKPSLGVFLPYSFEVPKIHMDTNAPPSSLLKSGNSWNLVSLLVFSIKGGERGMLKASGLNQQEGQLI